MAGRNRLQQKIYAANRSLHKVAIAWNKTNPDRHRNSILKHKYGITTEQYNELLEAQDGCCAVCKRHHSEFKKRLCVDHAHAGKHKGHIRGLLCSNCNLRVVGRHHDPTILRAAADYLEKEPTEWIAPERKRRRRRKSGARKSSQE